MNTGLSFARQSVDAEPAPHVVLARCEVPEDVTKVVQLVGEDKRVLVLGEAEAGLLRVLEQQGCEVVSAPTDATGTGLDLPREKSTDGFDVVLAVNALEHLRDPLAVLKDTKAFLRRDGFLVARVPNVAHGSIRLALLAGRFPFAEGGEVVRFFTYESLVNLIEKAGFAIGMVDRQEAEVAPPDGAPEGVVAGLLDTVSETPEFRTLQFVTVAYPLPSPGLGWLQTRLRALAEQNATATREAAEFREDLGAIKSHVEMLVEQQEASLRRERQLQAKIVEGHEHLARRDEEYRGALRNLQEAAAREKDLTDRLEAVGAVAAESARREEYAFALLRQLDETNKQLGETREQLDAANRQLGEANRRLSEIEQRLARFRRSLPGRFYRLIRGAMGK